jgi:DNA-binding PadR family transcriptional regulator
MLDGRSWTGYELTQQLRRSLRFVWPSSEGHLYREQKRLADLGWATVEKEPAGARSRNRYHITPQGRAALRHWRSTTPEEPHFEIEGILRLFFADRGTPEELTASMNSTANATRAMIDELVEYVDEYLEVRGPMWMLEHGVGGPGERLEFHGREVIPERLHVVTLVLEATTAMLAHLQQFAEDLAHETRKWESTTDPALTPHTRRRLENISRRHTT